jgi:hypothetical protein
LKSNKLSTKAVPETIYNLFVYTDGKVIKDLGIERYRLAEDGSDLQKIAFLQERALIDHATAYKARLVSPVITSEEFRAMQIAGVPLELFEELFELAGAPRDPLFALTVIVNGVPQVDGIMLF